MRALLVEDDQTIADFVARGLREAGFTVDRAADGDDGLRLAATGTYDVAIVDVMLPKLDGLSLIKELRRRQVTTPVLILSARHTVDDRVTGLEAGGDDYLIKPFAFTELLARVQALIRRATAAPASTQLTVGDLTLDLRSRRAVRAGREIELRPREFALLEYLMRNAGRVVSKTMILSHVWDYSFDPRTNVVDVLVFRLREKIDKRLRPQDDPDRARGMGYVTPGGVSACATRSDSASPSWYAAIFVVSSLALIALTYVLVAASLRQYDREIIQHHARPVRPGVPDRRRRSPSARRSSARRQRPPPAPCSCARSARRQVVTFLSMPEGWRDFDLSQLQMPSPDGEQTWSTLDTGQDGFELEVASVRLRDGTLFQVGMSTERRARAAAAVPQRPVDRRALAHLRRPGRRRGADVVGAAAGPAPRRHRAHRSCGRAAPMHGSPHRTPATPSAS